METRHCKAQSSIFHITSWNGKGVCVCLFWQKVSIIIPSSIEGEKGHSCGGKHQREKSHESIPIHVSLDV